MVDHCDKHVKLESFVFDEENQEQKPWKLFGRTSKRSLFVFSGLVFVILLMLVYAIVQIMLSTTYEETTYCVAIFTVDYIRPSPKL